MPDRGPFVAVAADAESEELALFYEQVAEMMRAYYMAFGGVQRLVPFRAWPACSLRTTSSS